MPLVVCTRFLVHLEGSSLTVVNLLVLKPGRVVDGRRLVVQRRVRSLGMVTTRHASIVVRASSIDTNQCWFKHSSRNLALNASIHG
jgi:hypothetical protein